MALRTKSHDMGMHTERLSGRTQQRFFEPDAGEMLSALGAAGPKVRQPQVCLPQERDAALSKSTSVRSDRHLVRRRYVAEAE